MTESVLIRNSDPIVVVAPSDSKTVLVQPTQTTVQVTMTGGESYLISQQQGPPGIPGLIGPVGPQGPVGVVDTDNLNLDGGNF